MEEKERLQKLLEDAKAVELKPVVSSNISAVGYNEETRLMKIAFKCKENTFTTYLYEGVEPEIYNEMLKAESKGKFLSENVIRHRDKYKYIKL